MVRVKQQARGGDEQRKKELRDKKAEKLRLDEEDEAQLGGDKNRYKRSVLNRRIKNNPDDAAEVAFGLVSSFPYIRIGLLVGIGAGNPECDRDIRLGDVAVSCPEGTSSGVIQYDTGEHTSNGWIRTGALTSPPQILLSALAKLKAEHELKDSRIPSILQKAALYNKKFAENYMHPGVEHDHLFCDQNSNDAPMEVQRPARTHSDPVIHYGTIASGNKLIKDAKERRKAIDSIGCPCICLEMEAAGLMNSFPCLVIRGICGL